MSSVSSVICSVMFSGSISSGWWLSPTPLKNHGVRHLGWLFTIYGKIKHVPNHQPVLVLGADLQYAHVWVSLRFGGGLRHFGWFFFVQYKALETSSFYSYKWAYHSINRVITCYNWLNKWYRAMGHDCRFSTRISGHGLPGKVLIALPESFQLSEQLIACGVSPQAT